MTRDEILDEYEALWRQAALEGRMHWAGPAANGRTPDLVVIENPAGNHMACAWLAAPLDLQDQARAEIRWLCTCGFETVQLNNVMIHLNNAHHWTWDMFANKFPDVLAEGEALAREAAK